MKQPILAILVAVVSLLCAYVYSRKDVLQLFVYNAPGKLESRNNLPNHQVRFANVIRNCEDVFLNEEAGWAMLSCDPGRDTWNTVMGNFQDPKAPMGTGLYIYRYADRPDAPPEKLQLLDFKKPEEFHPLGIAYHASSQRLFVANPAVITSRLEIFKLFEQENAATHLATIQHPFINTPNAIEVVDESEILVTNDHFFQKRYGAFLADVETYLTLPLAGFARVHLGNQNLNESGNVTTLAKMPFANGIALLNETHVAIASSSGISVRIYASLSSFRATEPDAILVKTISVPFHPDNLSVDKNGKLLIAGHAHSPTLSAVAKNAARVDKAARVDRRGDDVRTPSYVVEWSEESGLKELYIGTEFMTSTTAVRDVQRGFGIVTGLYEKGIMTWSESR